LDDDVQPPGLRGALQLDDRQLPSCFVKVSGEGTAVLAV
jgi:hypothetical protein